MRKAVVLILALLGACSDEQQPNTPRESVRAFGAALAELDYDAIRPHVTGDEVDLAHLEAFLEFARAGVAYKTTFLATYGEKGWEIFNDNEDATISVVQNDDLTRFDRMTYEFDGDRATGTMPGEAQKLYLERSGQRWSVRLRESMGFPEQQLIENAAQYRELAPLIRAAIPRIGAEGVTPDMLDAELGAAMAIVFGK